MSDHGQLADRLRRANPVHDPHDPPAEAWGRDLVLLEIQRRRIQVSTTDERTRQHPPTRTRPGRGLIAAAAAFAVVIVLGAVGYLVFASGAEGDLPPATTTSAPTTTQPPATTTTTEPATTTTQPATTTTVDAAIFPGVENVTFGRIDAGRVAAESGVAVPFAVTVPDVTAEFPSGLWVEQPFGPGVGFTVDWDESVDGPPPVLIMVMTRSSDTHEAVAADIADEWGDAAERDDAGDMERSEATVGGRPAIVLTAEVADQGDDALGGFPLYSLGTASDGGPYFGSSPGLRNRFYVIDTGGGTLVAWLEVPRDAWETIAAYFEEMVASLEFGPRGP